MTPYSTSERENTPTTGADDTAGSSTMRFINALFEPGDTMVFRPIETWEENGKKRSRVDYKGIQYHTLGTRANDGAWRALRERTERFIVAIKKRSEGLRTNLFFGTCPRFGGNGQYDLAWQIRTVRVLWADVDDCAVEETIERCKKAGLPDPSIVVASGHGAHLYWLLDVPYLIDDVGDPPPVYTEWTEKNGKKKPRKFTRDGGTKQYLDIPANRPQLSEKAVRVQDVLAGIADAIGGDHTTDLSRLLRLPGTMNRKNQRNGAELVPCALIECHRDRRYAFSVFGKFADASPSKKEREKIAKVKLPTTRKLTPAKNDKLDRLILACDTAPVGERSEVDWALVTFAIEKGVDQAEVWQRVQGVGKFAERGEEYFHRTWGKAAQHTRQKIFTQVLRNGKPKNGEKPAQYASAENSAAISNAIIVNDGESPKVIPLPMTDVIKGILDAADNWPRQVEGVLFAHDDGGVHWLDSPASTFGWLSDRCGIIDWRRAQGCVTKEETFHQLRRAVQRYDAIEELPHHPPIKGHYYTANTLSPGDGSALAELLEFFSLATPIDKQLLIAALATPLWGGAPGSRPAFMFTAKKGRGKGKTTLAEKKARIYGGHIDISANEDIGMIKSRLLSPEAVSKRIALLDNVKRTRFSSAELEALITADTISGKRMYVGEWRRPNYLTWLITLNGASLSTDLAQRVVEIAIANPNYSDTWEAKVDALIDTKREAILSDLVGVLEQPQVRMRRHTRWATWEGAVLSRVEDPDACLDLIVERRGAVDAELEEGELLESYFASQLRRLDYDSERNDVFIPSSIAARWYNAATGERRKTVGAARCLKQAGDEGRVHRITYCRIPGEGGRGFRWIGTHCDVADVTHYDLGARLARQTEQRQERQDSEF